MPEPLIRTPPLSTPLSTPLSARLSPPPRTSPAAGPPLGRTVAPLGAAPRPAPAARVLVDCAGAWMGGAKRFLDELDGFLASGAPGDAPGVTVVGRQRSLSLGWLAQRERLTHHDRTVALNNVSFVGPGGQRWVLLRNALHFLGPEDRAFTQAPAKTRLQVPVVRLAAARADTIIVPTTAMAERVLRVAGSLRDRLVVRPHPVTAPAGATSTEARIPGQVLCPVLFGRFKNMGPLLRLVDDAAGLAARATGRPIRILVTATEGERAAAALDRTRRLTFIGRLDQTALIHYRLRSAAVIYPTRLESFGYPLAEAQVERRPVIAADTAHNREVAGDALVGYAHETVDDVAAALITATSGPTLPGAGSPRYDRDAYFRWLLDVPARP